MNKDCQLVIFTDKAYNAVIRETFEWEPYETGGILLGHILDNGCWLVMEVLPPGYGEEREGDNVHHEYAYFEYNKRFVNYLAKSVSEQYEVPLELLGLWHRHPGSMNVFSSTDDVTNKAFASLNPKGAISGLINVDPQLRMTMYHVPHKESNVFGRPSYDVVDVEVVGIGDVPEEFCKLRYYDGTERTLHPYPPRKSTSSTNENTIGSEGVNSQSYENKEENNLPNFKSWLLDLKKNNKLIVLIIALLFFMLSLKPLLNSFESLFDLFKELGTPNYESIQENSSSLIKQNGNVSVEISDVDNN
jgi:hypothetical protein